MPRRTSPLPIGIAALYLFHSSMSFILSPTIDLTIPPTYAKTADNYAGTLHPVTVF